MAQRWLWLNAGLSGTAPNASGWVPAQVARVWTLDVFRDLATEHGWEHLMLGMYLSAFKVGPNSSFWINNGLYMFVLSTVAPETSWAHVDGRETGGFQFSILLHGCQETRGNGQSRVLNSASFEKIRFAKCGECGAGTRSPAQRRAERKIHDLIETTRGFNYGWVFAAGNCWLVGRCWLMLYSCNWVVLWKCEHLMAAVRIYISVCVEISAKYCQVSKSLGRWRRRHPRTLLNNFCRPLTEMRLAHVGIQYLLHENETLLVFGSKQDVKKFPWCTYTVQYSGWQRMGIQRYLHAFHPFSPQIQSLAIKRKWSSQNDPNESKWGDSFCLNMWLVLFELFALLAKEEADVYGGSPSRDDDRCSCNGTGELALLFLCSHLRSFMLIFSIKSFIPAVSLYVPENQL